MNTPIEILEMSFPVRVDEYVLVTDSGGAGRFRGGLGASRTWTVLDHKARASACLERTKSAPFGLSGGKPGLAAKIWTEAPNGDKGIAPEKVALTFQTAVKFISESRVQVGLGIRPSAI